MVHTRPKNKLGKILTRTHINLANTPTPPKPKTKKRTPMESVSTTPPTTKSNIPDSPSPLDEEAINQLATETTPPSLMKTFGGEGNKGEEGQGEDMEWAAICKEIDESGMDTTPLKRKKPSSGGLGKKKAKTEASDAGSSPPADSWSTEKVTEGSVSTAKAKSIENEEE